ncbi:MAG TPA: TIR domain-containing protein [Pyrinomonadaceae bacterium]|nr:TIR domain-containing protein [Pyrinomonadaceae bacterium]
MKVFLSWSGESSKELAVILREWLSLVFPEVAFWLSSRDIQAGQRWGNELDRELEGTGFGIICLLPANLMSPWLLFEAGALSKSVASARVVPYCLGIEPEAIQGPLSRFQGVPADESGTRRLVESINSLLDNKRGEVALGRTFDKWWPDLKRDLDRIPAVTAQGPNLVRIHRILCAATTTFEELGAAEDMAILEANYPNLVTRLHNVKLAELRDALALNKFEIVHLLGYVQPKTGDFLFNDEERLPSSGLLQLIERSGTSLLFLATCDSLDLGAILSRSVSVIAAAEDIDSVKMISWARCFYGLLGKGTSLASAYDLAQATAGLPMRLLIRNDAVFVPA